MYIKQIARINVFIITHYVNTTKNICNYVMLQFFQKNVRVGAYILVAWI